MTSGRHGRNLLMRKSILKSSKSDLLGGTPGRSKRARRAVSFCNNLERVHFFDPSQTFKRGRNVGNSHDFRINITSTSRRSTSNNQRSYINNHMISNPSATAKRPDLTSFEQKLVTQMKGVKRQ